MVTWVTPPPTPRRQIPRLEALAGPGSALDERPDGAAPQERLVRVIELGRGEAAAYLDGWADQQPAAKRIEAPAGLAAAERRRPEAGVAAAQQTMRLQRLAVAETATGALAAHWSVPEPPTTADVRAWQRLLDRLTPG